MEQRKPPKEKSPARTPWQGIVVPALVIALILVALQAHYSGGPRVEIGYSKFKELLADSKVKNL